MSSCLGLYIESDLIKYAKVTKEKDSIRIDAFGVKFYNQIAPTISQIISETYSYKIPISINLSEETYQYFYFFNLLNKNDLKRAIDTEFDSYCFEKGYNRNALETRYALVQDLQDDEKIKAIYISANKAEINKKMQDFSGNPISNIVPLPMCITNVMKPKENANVAIINLEQKTTITTVIKNQIYDIDKIDVSMDTILSSISAKENSYAKAYEICKNTTIYTMDGQELLQDTSENMYLEEIMPTLFEIVQKIQEIISKSVNRIDKIYITGSGCVINNIDLYFQEYFPNIKCEILKPYFVPDNIKINIKDYIEVNSATALALQGLDIGIKKINFKAPTLTDNLPEWLKFDFKSKKTATTKDKNTKGKSKSNFSIDWKAKFDNSERWLTRAISGILIFIISYIGITTFLNGSIDDKMSEAQTLQTQVQSEISKIDSATQKLNNKTSDYKQKIANLQKYSSETAENLRIKNSMPILLTRIMNIIPKDVTITSIENTTESHVVIKAQSQSYDQLGFFKGSLIVDGVLSPSTVVSNSGVKQDGIIKIVIEGDLP